MRDILSLSVNGTQCQIMLRHNKLRWVSDIICQQNFTVRLMKLVWIFDSVVWWIKWLNIHPKRWTQWRSKRVCYRRKHRNIHNTIFDNRKMRLNEISQTFRSWTFGYVKAFCKVKLSRDHNGDNSLCLKSMITFKTWYRSGFQRFIALL